MLLHFLGYDSRQDTKNDFKILTKRKEMFGLTPQKMEGLCYVMRVTGHKAYTGKEEEGILFLNNRPEVGL
jgi:hypothetical protein